MFQSLSAIPLALVRHRYLIWQLSWREIAGRYRGSLVGILWSFITPMIMLAIYTLVFGVMFKSRWGTPEAAGGAPVGDGHLDFALILFTGLILHGFLTECLGRSCTLVLGNANLVKRVVFPLDILGWTVVVPALFHSAIGFLILLAASLLLHGGLPWTALLVPLVLVPFVLLCLGLIWFLSATGVFVRDIGQAVGPLTTILMFLSPIAFPLSAIPEGLRPIVALNPLTVPVEAARDLLIWGRMPDWGTLGIYAVIAALIAWGGAHWFRRSRPAFADVM